MQISGRCVLSGNPHNSGGIVQKLLVTSAIGLVLYRTWPVIAQGAAAEWQTYAWGAGAVLCLAGAGAVGGEIARLTVRVSRAFRALRPRLPDSSARWLTRKEAQRAGLGETKGLFLGIVDGLPLFIDNAVHGLVCAPARKGKTTSFVMNALCGDIGTSRLVIDMKGELAVQTKALVGKRHGHRVIILNPAHKFDLGNAAYNPMQIILDDLESAPEDVMSDALSLALQLYPVSPGGDRDPFWPNGTRKHLVFVIVALCALRGGSEANLTRAFEVLSDEEDFRALLREAMFSHILAGELSRLAANISSTWEENPKHFESFREGAVQVLLPFGPSGRLASSVADCDFRFRDLKRTKMTIYLICDPSRMDVFAPWLGLLIWAALKELVREDNAIPVHLSLDEFTNVRLSGLPEALTGLGGLGIRVFMVVQELEEIARVYGREALKTILSQTDVKQFFGVASGETAQMVSRSLGEEEWVSESFGMGDGAGDTPSLSLARQRRPLLTPDEVRRLPDDEQIIFIKNLRAARALKVGYHEIEPFRRQVRPNPLHGGKPFLGKVKMRIRSGKAIATRAGKQKVQREARPLFRPLLAAMTPLVPGAPVLFLAGAALLVITYGWPYLRFEYTHSHSWCRYVGPPLVTTPFENFDGPPCPLIVWRHSGGLVR